MKLNDFIIKNTPPGIELKAIKKFYIFGLVIVTCLSLGFFVRYFEALHELFMYENVKGSGGVKVLIEGAKIADFRYLLGNALAGFPFLAVCIFLYFTICNYQYYRQGSMNIYLMKRLPKKWELHKRGLTVPVLAALSCIVIAILLMLLYFVIYLILTPNVCLSPNQWQKLWRI